MRESKRESRMEARAGKSWSGPETSGRKSSDDIACDDAPDSAGWFPQRCNARLQVPNPVPTAPPHRTTCVCPFDCQTMDANAPLSFLTVPELRADLTFFNVFVKNKECRAHNFSMCAIGSRALEGRRRGSDNLLRISSQPGANSALPIAPTCALCEPFVHPRPCASFATLALVGRNFAVSDTLLPTTLVVHFSC